jgi:hypothetical protein
MARKPVHGNCRICGRHKKLSFEHVPPRSAFNKHSAVIKRLPDFINKNPDDYFEKGGKISQKGVGDHTLCEKCNNDTGGWYGDAFAEWAHQGMDLLRYAQEYSSPDCTFRIYPLRVIKQVICMFFSTNSDRFRYNYPDLVKFVLNKQERHLDPRIRIFAFYSASSRGRYIGGAIEEKINPDEINPDVLDSLLSKVTNDFDVGRVLREVAFPPIGYRMTFDSEPPDSRLVDISDFAEYSYRDRKSIELGLPVLPVYTYLPGDYRDRDQVRRALESNT